MKKSENPLFGKPFPTLREYGPLIIQMLIIMGIFELAMYMTILWEDGKELYMYDYDTDTRVLSGRMMVSFWESAGKADGAILLIFWASVGMFSLIPLIRLIRHISERSIYTILRIPERHERLPQIRIELTKKLLLPAVYSNGIVCLVQAGLFLVMAALYYLLIPNEATPQGQVSVFAMLHPGFVLAVAAGCVWIPAMLLALLMFRGRSPWCLCLTAVFAAYAPIAHCAENGLGVWAMAGSILLAAVVSVGSEAVYLSKGFV